MQDYEHSSLDNQKVFLQETQSLLENSYSMLIAAINNASSHYTLHSQ